MKSHQEDKRGSMIWGRGGQSKGKRVRRLVDQQRDMEWGEAAPERFQAHGFACSFLPCLQARELCCDAACERLLAASLELAERSLRCSQPRRETGGCLMHLSWVPRSTHTTCARGNPALLQTRPARLQNGLESWVQ